MGEDGTEVPAVDGLQSAGAITLEAHLTTRLVDLRKYVGEIEKAATSVANERMAALGAIMEIERALAAVSGK